MTEAMDDGAPFYLRGVHAPVDEEVEAFDLPVEGAIPPELDGRFLRNGPNPASGDPGHWFLGDGMLHGVRIEGGRARWYRNRWVRTRALTEGARWMQPDGRLDDTAGLANTHVVAHAEQQLAEDQAVDDAVRVVGDDQERARARHLADVGLRAEPVQGEFLHRRGQPLHRRRVHAGAAQRALADPL